MTIPTLTPQMLSQSYCVYQHINLDGAVLQTGVCKLSNVFRPPSKPSKTWWAEASEGFTLHIPVTGDRETCLQAAEGLPRYMRPANPHRSAVRRVSDGQTWPSISHAARSLKVAPSTISNHLNGVYGYGTVRGERYERV